MRIEAGFVGDWSSQNDAKHGDVGVGERQSRRSSSTQFNRILSDAGVFFRVVPSRLAPTNALLALSRSRPPTSFTLLLYGRLINLTTPLVPQAAGLQPHASEDSFKPASSCGRETAVTYR